MTMDELRITRESNPFRPFTIHLADGRSLHVPHRDYLSISPEGNTVIVYKNNGGFSILDLMLITELTVEAPVARSTNGPPA